MWHFRASQVVLEPAWHQNCTARDRVTLIPTDFRWVNSRAICPTEDSKRLGRDVLSKIHNSKLENYRGIGEQWTSDKAARLPCYRMCHTPLLACISTPTKVRTLG